MRKNNMPKVIRIMNARVVSSNHKKKKKKDSYYSTNHGLLAGNDLIILICNYVSLSLFHHIELFEDKENILLTYHCFFPKSSPIATIKCV